MKLKGFISISLAAISIATAVQPTLTVFAASPESNPIVSGDVSGHPAPRYSVYKQTSSGSYSKIDSESIEESGSSFVKYGTLASDGPGKYKIKFVGKVYASGGSESITINSYDSY